MATTQRRYQYSANQQSVEAATDRESLILKGVLFTDGKPYDVRICQYDRSGNKIGVPEGSTYSETTLRKIQTAAAEIFQTYKDPSSVTIRYKSPPNESCISENPSGRFQRVELIRNNKHKEIVDQARRIYECLLPCDSYEMCTDSDVNLISSPLKLISDAEATRWKMKGQNKRAESLPPTNPQMRPDSKKNKDATPPQKPVVPPEKKPPEAADPKGAAPVSNPEPSAPPLDVPPNPVQTKELIFAHLNQFPLTYKGIEYRYSELHDYAVKKGKQASDPFHAVYTALQKVIATPDAKDENEIRLWILKLWAAAYTYYPDSRDDALRVVLTYLVAGVDFSDYQERLLQQTIPVPSEMGVQIGNAHITMELGDITKATEVEAIVNAANKQCLGGEGVDGAIRAAAGQGLAAECWDMSLAAKNGVVCETGHAVITGSHDLARTGDNKRIIKNIIHAVGPDTRVVGVRDDLLSQTYESALTLAHQKGIKTIAFPSISTGIYGFPFDRATQIAVETIETYCRKNPGHFDKIKLIFFTQDQYDSASALFNKMHQYK